MTTSSTMSLSSVISLEDKPVSAFEIGYLKATAQDDAYESFLGAFLKERAKDPSITKAFIARRTGKSPEQITRYLGSPGNWTIDTYAVLCAAIGYKPVFSVEKIADMRQGNACHPLISACEGGNLLASRPGRVLASLAVERLNRLTPDPFSPLNGNAGRGLENGYLTQEREQLKPIDHSATTLEPVLGPKNALHRRDPQLVGEMFRTGIGA